MATDDTTWALNKTKIWIPKHKKRTGFEDKTRWDWLQLVVQIVGAIAIPLSLLVGILQFNAQQNSDNLRTSEEQQTQFRILDEQQQQVSLSTYLDQMSQLLLNPNLRADNQGGYDIRSLARARTLETLLTLNPMRKSIVLKFIYDAGLIRRASVATFRVDPAINLAGADLSEVDLIGFNLAGADLALVNLTRADLSGANLSSAYLAGTKLSEANLIGANLSFAQFYYQFPSQPPEIVDLSDANLSYSILVGTDLTQANLRGAVLTGVDLSKADLKGATITNAQLVQAKALNATIMPDGSIHP